MGQNQLQTLLKEMQALPKECEWVEFKMNNSDPELIGEYLSALSNSACYHKKQFGYLVFGICNDTHDLIGTTYRPRLQKKGNMEIENWWAISLAPRIDFNIYEFIFDEKNFVVIRVQAAKTMPVEFCGKGYIRVGSVKKNIKEHPEKLRRVWDLTGGYVFEKAIAAQGLSQQDVLTYIDYPAFFRLMSLTLPEGRIGIISKLKEYKIIEEQHGNYSITNMGALLFAFDSGNFETLKPKMSRVIVYQGDNRTNTIKEQVGKKGYAVGFEGLINFISDNFKTEERISGALREEGTYPLLAIRELVANAMIHQDFETTGSYLMIELFDNRIEITNPGIPIVDPLRFVDHNSQSRNEALAYAMRLMRICEQRGSGYDKVVSQCELYNLPAPEVVVGDNYTRVILQRKTFSDMTRAERISSCYYHACLMHESGKRMTNESLRKRFRISDDNYRAASAIINDAIKQNLIKSAEGETARKYVPIWA